MDTYLQRGYIEFKTLAPVFIGSGKELNKKEYIYDRSSGSIYLVDFKKMVEGLQSRHLMDAFES
jgi:CRISPR-associated protein Csm5